MFFQIFIIGLLLAISPGPDFFIVMKNSLGYGKKIGIASAIGISTALFIHVSYTILGLAIILKQYIFVFKFIQILGACYLIYLGMKSIILTFSNKKGTTNELKTINYKDKYIYSKKFAEGFRNGFICNILNPKAFLFFLSVFSQFMTPHTPRWIESIYGLEIILAVGGWFTILSIMSSSRIFRTGYNRCRNWIDRLFGALLLFFAYKICKSVFD
ncbi:LysE family translocator [Clostridium arbusti]|uniref:LysE family translocator n=1 Tax=Clostridium arbusti TaxID=1137848 RepID=UPI000288F546|nr:LysE family translocator [Clostridium arbusti]